MSEWVGGVGGGGGRNGRGNDFEVVWGHAETRCVGYAETVHGGWAMGYLYRGPQHRNNTVLAMQCEPEADAEALL